MQPILGSEAFFKTDQLHTYLAMADIDCSEAKCTGRDSLADTVVEMRPIRNKKKPETIVLLAMRPSCAKNNYQASLESQGFKVIAIDDADEGLRVLKELVPSVVVVEPELERGGGERLLDAIQGEMKFHQIPVLVVTTATSRSSIYKLAKFDIDDVIILPAGVAEFMIRVVKLLGDGTST